MSYRFVPPRLHPDDSGARPMLPAARPEVGTLRVLGAEACRSLADTVIAAHEAGLSWASRTRYAAPEQWDVNQQFRRSKNVSPKLEGLAGAYEAMHAAVAAQAPALGCAGEGRRLAPVTEQCLVYHEGDRIGDHADDSTLEEDDQGEPAWRVIKPERHVVAILWLTTQVATSPGRHEFSGGTLRFNSLVEAATGRPLDIRPTAGTMVVFPATPWFRHEVLPVEGGTRIALTRWWQVVPVHAPALV